MDTKLTIPIKEQKKKQDWKARDHIPICAYIMHHRDGSLGRCNHHVDTETFIISRFFPGDQAIPIYCNYHLTAHVIATKEERKVKQRARVSSYYNRMKELEKQGDPVATAYLNRRREIAREFKQKNKDITNEYAIKIATE
jgi:hypothetical protein